MAARSLPTPADAKPVDDKTAEAQAAAANPALAVYGGTSVTNAAVLHSNRMLVDVVRDSDGNAQDGTESVKALLTVVARHGDPTATLSVTLETSEDGSEDKMVPGQSVDASKPGEYHLSGSVQRGGAWRLSSAVTGPPASFDLHAEVE